MFKTEERSDESLFAGTFAIALIFCSGCGVGHPDPANTADSIYFGGHIITVNDAQPTVEALAVKDDKILMVGTRAEIEKFHKGATTHMIDLAGKTLFAGFLDPHSHYISSITVANQVNVFAPPAGPGKDVSSIVAELKKYRDANKIPPGEVIQAYGYDENVMPKDAELTRDDLDKDFPDNPVIVGHVSMHGAVLNSAAIKSTAIPQPPRLRLAASSFARKARTSLPLDHGNGISSRVRGYAQAKRPARN